MFNRDRWFEILETIKNNKLRTFLAGFTVALGILILIVLVGFGNGAQLALQYANYTQNASVKHIIT